MRLAKWALLAILGASVAVAGTSGQKNSIPQTLAGYRSWTKLTEEPRPIPYYMGAACAPPIGEREKYGPHNDRWLMVYANPAASAALRSKDAKQRFPVGSMIAKEKRLQPGDEVPEGVAFMIKRADERFAKSGGWEFLYFPSAGADTDSSSCVSCHRAGAPKDYVFSTFSHAAK